MATVPFVDHPPFIQIIANPNTNYAYVMFALDKYGKVYGLRTASGDRTPAGWVKLSEAFGSVPHKLVD
jgi:hypothetical protein